jgi:hypothetical protein
VRDSDGTVIFSIGRKLTGGSRKTAVFARRLGKPWLHLTGESKDASGRLKEFLGENRISVLNVAGPRESGEPEIGRFVRRVLRMVFGGSCSAGGKKMEAKKVRNRQNEWGKRI